MRSRLQIGLGVVAGSLFNLLLLAPLLAQELTSATIERLQNQVQLLLRNQTPRRANTGDRLVPQDAVRTGTGRSRAELLFNEGAIARIGSNATFRFTPGLRRFQLPNSTGSRETNSDLALLLTPLSKAAIKSQTSEIAVAKTELSPRAQVPTSNSRVETIFQLLNGTAVILSQPESSGSTIETPQSRIEIIAANPANAEVLIANSKSTAIAVLHDGAQNTTQVFNLTNLPIRVTNLDGTQSVFLRAGQTVSVSNGTIGAVQDFNLEKFYQTSELAAGLGPGQEAFVEQQSPPVRDVLNAVREETLSALQAQNVQVEGLCTLNGRGGASTLSSNCITTGADEPLRRFEDDREVVTPPQPQTRTPDLTP
jgi:hypothetical protein